MKDASYARHTKFYDFYQKLLSHGHLHAVISEEGAIGEGAVHVIHDKFEYFFLLGVLLQGGVLYVGIDHDEVVFALSLQSLLIVILAGGQILQQQFPGATPMFLLRFRWINTGMPSHAYFFSL